MDIDMNDIYKTMTGNAIWIIIFLASLRGVYQCTKTKDFIHFACFIVLLLFSAFMLANNQGLLPPALAQFF